MKICLFEDHKTENFYPLTLSRPVYELLCGTGTLSQKLRWLFPESEFSFFCRKYLKHHSSDFYNTHDVSLSSDSYYFLFNGRLANVEMIKSIFTESPDEEKLFLSDDSVCAAIIKGSKLKKLSDSENGLIELNSFTDIKSETIDLKLYNFIWDLIYDNGNRIRTEFQSFKQFFNTGNTENNFRDIHLISPENIIIGKGTKIYPGVVIDASDGPVIIGNNSIILPACFIEGPCFIGDNVKIKAGSTIYQNVSIGSVCKIGGEVEDSVIMPYSNKQHSGFIGHSYIGSWVNLGADTNCSDLKNNYSTVKVRLNQKQIDTGKQFLGLIMGDHSKTAINTMFNTGTVAGFSANIFGAGFPGKFIPSFSWGGDNLSVYDPEKAISVAEKVMMRRNISMSTYDKELFKKIFEMTENERKQ
ncbi:MAG: GlmU family protein [Ignavibacteriaceae bacterium]